MIEEFLDFTSLPSDCRVVDRPTLVAGSSFDIVVCVRL